MSSPSKIAKILVQPVDNQGNILEVGFIIKIPTKRPLILIFQRQK